MRSINVIPTMRFSNAARRARATSASHNDETLFGNIPQWIVVVRSIFSDAMNGIELARESARSTHVCEIKYALEPIRPIYKTWKNLSNSSAKQRA
jgi:hypothetical protein